MQNYSNTQLFNLIKLISALMVVAGFKPFSEEEASALLIVGGLLLEAISFCGAWYERYKRKDVTLAGFRKPPYNVSN